jgi:hypothetical protein
MLLKIIQTAVKATDPDNGDFLDSPDGTKSKPCPWRGALLRSGRDIVNHGHRVTIPGRRFCQGRLTATGAFSRRL